MDGKMDTLKYIADSPPRECGGFHEYTVEAAKWAIAEIERLTRERDEAREASRWLCDRVGIMNELTAWKKWIWLAH